MAIPLPDIVRRSGTLCRCLSALMLICTLPTCAVARQGQSLMQMDHAMWTARAGAPQGIRSLALANDGTLWVGAESGLINFDGRTFSAFHSPPGEPELPALPVWSILVVKDGALRVGFFQGGVARMPQGHVTLYANVEDKPLALMEYLREGADGSIDSSNTLWLVQAGHPTGVRSRRLLTRKRMCPETLYSDSRRLPMEVPGWATSIPSTGPAGRN